MVVLLSVEELSAERDGRDRDERKTQRDRGGRENEYESVT